MVEVAIAIRAELGMLVVLTLEVGYGARRVLKLWGWRFDMRRHQ